MKNNFCNLKISSYFSIGEGLSSPTTLVKTAKELGQSAIALTDHASISGCVKFAEACKKQGIKSLLGNEFNICDSIAVQDKNNRYKHQVIIARNLIGWKKLIQLTSISNDEGFYYKPRIDEAILKEVADNSLISFSGHPGSTLANEVSENDVIRSDAIERGVAFCERMRAIFGDGFFIEIQILDNSEYVKQLAACLREVAVKTGIKTVATGDVHYARKQDAEDQRLILCSNLKITLPQAYKQVQSGKLNMSGFFNQSELHLRTYNDLLSNTEEERKNTVLLADMVEEYNIFSHPVLPHFNCPNGLSEGDYLRQLCRNGWLEKNKNWDHKIYGDRVKHELDVISKSNILESYFLIVDDFVRWARNQGIMTGVGRGSAAGSMVAYLLGVTRIEPIQYDLIFERFYNEGRNTPDRVALPDIDIDFPVYRREEVIEYLKDKYGINNVCQMSTFGTLQGKGAIKEVLRITDSCSFQESNDICNMIPDESKINDQMQETDETSVLSWILKNDPKLVSKYCQLNDDGSLSGEYAQQFEQAIRIEGTIKSQGKHPSGIIIFPHNLNHYCPMVKPSTQTDKISGFDMEACEKIGLVKFDLLAVSAYDKLSIANKLIIKKLSQK